MEEYVWTREADMALTDIVCRYFSIRCEGKNKKLCPIREEINKQGYASSCTLFLQSHPEFASRVISHYSQKLAALYDKKNRIPFFEEHRW